MKLVAKATYNFVVAFTVTFVAIGAASYGSSKLVDKITFK